MLSMMLSALLCVRLAMQTLPNRSLFWAHLWAETCATAPAPTMRTFGFILLCAKSGEAATEIIVCKLSHKFNAAVEPAHHNGGHLHAIEPVHLDHGVTRGVVEDHEIADLELVWKVIRAPDVPGQAGIARDRIAARAAFRQHTFWQHNGRILPVDQIVEHMRLDRRVDDGDAAVMLQDVLDLRD